MTPQQGSGISQQVCRRRFSQTLAAVIVRLADVDKPPASFVARSDAVDRAANAIAARKADFDGL
jgi:hypothetical protein